MVGQVSIFRNGNIRILTTADERKRRPEFSPYGGYVTLFCSGKRSCLGKQEKLGGWEDSIPRENPARVVRDSFHVCYTASCSRLSHPNHGGCYGCYTYSNSRLGEDPENRQSFRFEPLGDRSGCADCQLSGGPRDLYRAGPPKLHAEAVVGDSQPRRKNARHDLLGLGKDRLLPPGSSARDTRVGQVAAQGICFVGRLTSRAGKLTNELGIRS